jgi:4-amino-4-deoxy-L-arabinose transferase-like glycosyltransferase
MLLLSRLGSMLLSIIFGIVVYSWARRMFGVKGGLLALFLYVFCPIILSVSTIIGKDLAVSFFVFVTIYFVWLFYRTGKTLHLVLSGLMAGLAQVADYPAIFLYPLLGLLFLILLVMGRGFHFRSAAISSRLNRAKSRFWKNLWGMALVFVVILLLSYLVIILTYACSTYGLRGIFRPFDYSIARDTDISYSDYKAAARSMPLVNLIVENVPLPLPYYYLKGLGLNIWVSAGVSGAGPTYLVNGEPKLIWYYFILSYLLKTPLAEILFFLAALLVMALLDRKRADEYLFLVLPIVVYNAFFALTTKQFAYKYILPAIPFTLVVSGNIFRLGELIKKGWVKKTAAVVLGLLCLWCAASVIANAPHYGSYFNEIIGGSANGYKYFVLTNVDAGQDLYYLRDYLNEKGITDFRFKFYGYPTLYSNSLPKFMGIPYNELGCGYQEGVVAISASFLSGNRSCYGWLMNETPMKRIGYSIFVYNITSPR